MIELGAFDLPDLTGIAGLVLVALLVLTDKLVWHTRLEKSDARCDRWETIALTALGVADKMTVTGEIAKDVLEVLPPKREGK